MEQEEKHLNPDVGIGDLFRYSALLGEVVSELSAIHNLPVGVSESLPSITSWLPDGHSYEFEIKVTRKG